MAISVRLNPEETKLLKSYAQLNDLSVSEVVRRSVLEHIDDQYDLQAFDEALEEYRANPVTYTQAEVAQNLGFQ